MWLLMIFLFLSLLGSVVGWGMGGTGLLVNSLFSDACTLMHGYINDKPNEWLDDQLSFCDDLEGARRGMYPAMEAANLAVEDANDQIRGMRLHDSFCWRECTGMPCSLWLVVWRTIPSLWAAQLPHPEINHSKTLHKLSQSFQATAACVCRCEPKSFSLQHVDSNHVPPFLRARWCMDSQQRPWKQLRRNH